MFPLLSPETYPAFISAATLFFAHGATLPASLYDARILSDSLSSTLSLSILASITNACSRVTDASGDIMSADVPDIYPAASAFARSDLYHESILISLNFDTSRLSALYPIILLTVAENCALFIFPSGVYLPPLPFIYPASMNSCIAALAQCPSMSDPPEAPPASDAPPAAYTAGTALTVMHTESTALQNLFFFAITFPFS